MSFKQKISQNIKESRENNGGGSSEELDQIDVDMDEIPFMKLSPTAMVRGTFPEDEGNPIIRFPDEKNEGRKDQGYLGLVMEDITLDTSTEETEGSLAVYDETDATDYRIFNTDDGKTEHVDGVGIKIEQQSGSALYDGDVIEGDELSVDRAIVVVSGTASTNVARRLDVKGSTYADMAKDGDGTNGGLIEVNPEPEDGPRTRYARNPELKSTLYGEEVGVMLARREEVDDEHTGYTGQGDGDTPVLGTGEDGTTHDNPVRASYAELVEADERRSMYWYAVFDSNDEIVEPTSDEEPVRRSFLEWRWDPDAEGLELTEDEEEFVEEYRESEKATDEETIRENIEAVRSEFDEEPDEEAIVTALQ